MKAGDKILFSVTAAYGVLNVVVMALAARGVVQLPWSMFGFFVVVGVIGALFCIVLLAFRNSAQITAVPALVAAAGFGLLAMFNLKCYAEALAAV